MLVFCRDAVCGPAAARFVELSVRAQTVSRLAAIDRFAKFMHPASDRSAVPARWIRAVLEIESGGDEHSISPRGAMGLMQLMPSTWVELTRYGLGLDLFEASDNILAGTAYLKEMHDCVDSAGFLAAYHAGLGRYERNFVAGKWLPCGFATEGPSLTGQEFAEGRDINVLMAYGRCLRPALYSSLRSSPSHPTGVSALRVTIAIASARFARKQWGLRKSTAKPRRLIRNETATGRRVRAGAAAGFIA